MAESFRGAALAVLLGIAALSCENAYATAADAQARFADGQSAFEANEFDQALALFENALELGLDTPAVHYNIGVAAYRAKRFSRAERAFREVARAPAMAALAHYNLGLVALQERDPSGARRWFARSAAGSQDERLAALARQRLSELPEPPAQLVGSYYFKAGAGADDNVALRPDGIFDNASGRDDEFVELLAAASLALRETWHLDAGATALRHLELDEFDQSSVSLGARRDFALASWDTQLGLHAAQIALGGEVFEQSASVSLRAARVLSGGQRFRAQLRGTAVDGRGSYPGLDGTRGDLSLDYEWQIAAWNFAAHARAELTSCEESAYEYRRAELGLSARWQVSPRWSLRAESGLRQLSYARQPADAPAREERRVAFALAAGVLLHPRVQAALRYEFEQNDASLEANDFDRNRISLSIETWR